MVAFGIKATTMETSMQAAARTAGESGGVARGLAQTVRLPEKSPLYTLPTSPAASTHAVFAAEGLWGPLVVWARISCDGGGAGLGRSWLYADRL
jgi:hypothetical protein